MTSMNKPTYTIDEVSRDLGIGKDTLRVWERRYGFPTPLRGDQGERIYPDEQVNRLRTISRLMDRGYRPGRVVAMSDTELDALARAQALDLSERDSEEVKQLVDLARDGELDEITRRLHHLMQWYGGPRFVQQVAAPLLDLTGRSWAAGQLSIYREHMLTQQLQRVLQDASHQIQPPAAGPTALLTTLPGERHGMGLLMVELMLRDSGVRTINLGVETPLDEVILACQQLKPDIAAISFSALQKRSMLLVSLRELCKKIPPSVTIMAGGEGVQRLRMLPERLVVIRDLEGIPAVVRPLTERDVH